MAGGLSLNVADLIYSFIMETLMVLEISLLPHMPYGSILSFVFTCWVTSLYCFEYGWVNAGQVTNAECVCAVCECASVCECVVCVCVMNRAVKATGALWTRQFVGSQARACVFVCDQAGP